MLYDFIDYKELKKTLPSLEEYNDWLPLSLIDNVNQVAYFSRVSDDVITDFYNRRHDALLVENPRDLLLYDLRLWIKENPEYKKIMRTE
jgi:hypothetical protein